MDSTLSASIDLPLSPQEAFDTLADELSVALANDGLTFTPGPGGSLADRTGIVGRVIAWEPGKRMVLRWEPADGASSQAAEVELRLEPTEGSTRVTLLPAGAGSRIGSAGELAAWFAGQVAAPLVRATAPQRIDDWITDRRARRPSGAQARGVYSDPLYHYPNFRVILSELALTKDDYLIDVGCGGGALLRDALKSGCRAAGVDHSADMVRVARRVNERAVADGRLVIEQADAHRLPFADETFTAASMTGVLGFLANPVAAFAELKRVLRPGGRLVALGSDPALRGTPAAPEPIASRLRFYNDEQLRQLALDAGFSEARVVRRDLLPFAREVGVPQEHLALFAAAPAPFLLARKVTRTVRSAMPPLRYVILRHEQVSEPHYDLMLETLPGSMLATWRLETWPLESATPLLRLRDHRRLYLTYEGDLTNSRGSVLRIAEGTCEVEVGEGSVWTIKLLTGVPPQTLRIRQVRNDEWQAEPI